MKGEVIDPTTGLSTDLAYHVELLGDLVREEAIQRRLVERKKATVDGLATLIGMLNATQEKLGQGWSPTWWSKYAHHVRTQLATVLEDKEVRKVIGMHLAWKRGAQYKAVLKELRDLQRDLKNRIERDLAPQRAGLIVVES